jgi:hypothetical protein
VGPDGVVVDAPTLGQHAHFFHGADPTLLSPEAI